MQVRRSMTIGDTMSADSLGRFVHYALSSKDPAAAQAFYCALFGWAALPDGRLAVHGRQFAEVHAGDPAPGWIGYVAVDDLEEALAIAQARGALGCGAPEERAGLGRVARVTDPEGAQLGLVAGLEEVAPDPERPLSGTPCWNVLVSQRPDEAVRFYMPLCGWSVEEVDLEHELLGTYYVADHDGQATAGIIRAIDSGHRPYWCLCVAVDDIDAALARGRSLGAHVAREPITVAEVGTYAILEDLEGTRVAVLRWNAQRRPW
jgi:predicted enzyme related to lactoylglutathione lyase